MKKKTTHQKGPITTPEHQRAMRRFILQALDEAEQTGYGSWEMMHGQPGAFFPVFAVVVHCRDPKNIVKLVEAVTAIMEIDQIDDPSVSTRA